MSNYLSKPSFILGLGLSTPTVLVTNVALAIAQSDAKAILTELPVAAANPQIQVANPVQSKGTS
jgi:hypothetical protein